MAVALSTALTAAVRDCLATLWQNAAGGPGVPDAAIWPALILLGVLVGAYGTIIGAGGGFVLAPFLLIVYPNQAPEIITAMSLCAVFFSSASGSVAYARQRRIDYSVALIFAAAEVPGAIAGAFTTELLPRSAFEGSFGLMLLAVATLLIARPVTPVRVGGRSRFAIQRLRTDVHGDTYQYWFEPQQAAVIGLGIGYAAGTFGVGGGFIYVPAMVLVMRFPSYIATPTSTFALMFAAAAAAGVHLLSGHYGDVVGETASLAVGVLVGAQLGALISDRLSSRQGIVLRLLSGALFIVSVRLLAGAVISV